MVILGLVQGVIIPGAVSLISTFELLFFDFWIEHGVSRGCEVLKRLAGVGALLCDQVWGCGEPWGPDSLPKP